MTLKQQACIMFLCRNKKDLLNFISERIKIVYWINLLGTAFKKHKLPLKFLKTKIYRPDTP